MAGHWKTRLIDKAYLGVYSLYDDALETQYIECLKLTIKGFERDKVFSQSKNAFEQKSSISFRETEQKLIVNATNGSRLEKLYGANPDKWIGKPCVLVVERDKRHGEVLRVSTDAKLYPNFVLPAISPSSDRWAGMVQAIKNGVFPIENVRAKFQILDSDFQLLTEQINAGI